MGLGITEILLLAVLVVLFFGARKIPGLARGLGEGIRNFKSGLKDPERLESGESPEAGEDERKG
jgi:sec-independent protein translocase protein TatA